MEGWEKEFKTKFVTRDKEGYYTMIKGSIHQEYIEIVTIYKPHKRASKTYEAKSNQTQKKSDSSTIIETSIIVRKTR